MASSGSFETTSYINQSLAFKWTIKSQSIADNTTTISWTLEDAGTYDGQWVACGGFYLVIDGEVVLDKPTDYRVRVYDGTVVASGEKTLTHNADGSRSFSASAQAGIYTYARNVSGSGTFTIDTIPRQATITSAPNFNDEASPVLKYNNPAGNAVSTLQACISLTGAKDDIAYRDISKTGNSYTFNLTDAERNLLRNNCTTANSRTIKFYIKTVIGSNTFYSSVAKTLSIVNATPTIEASVVDSGSVSKTLTGNTSTMIKGYNTMQAAMSITTLKGATVKSKSITNGSNTVNNTSATFSYTDTNTFVFKTTDSRGNSVSKTITIPMINYIKLTCNLAADNPTTDGVLNFKVSGNYWTGSFGAVSNTLTVQYRYKEDGGTYGAWTDLSPTISGTTYNVSSSVSGLDYRKAYVIQARAIDKVNAGGINTDEKKVKSITVFDWSENDFNFNVPVNVEGKIFANGNVNGGKKISIWTNNEGGNLQLESPNNVIWQMDAYDDNWRIYCNNSGTNKFPLTINKDGTITLNHATYYSGYSKGFYTPLTTGKIGMITTSNGLSFNMPYIADGSSSWTYNYMAINPSAKTMTVGASGNSLYLNGSTVYMGGNAVADFITAQGSSSGWYYRKYASGRAECYRYYKFTPTLTQLGNFYYGYTPSISLPFTFLTMSYINASVQYGGANVSWASGNTDSASNMTSIQALFVQVHSSTSGSRTLALHCVGTWK